MSAHAGTVGALRPLRRPPASARRSRAGRRPRPPARARSASPPRRCARRSPGWSGRAGCTRCGCPSGPGYLLTPKATRRLDDAGRPDLPHRPAAWDGTFDLLVIEPPTARAERQRLAATLGFLGYGALDAAHLGRAPRRPTRWSTLLDRGRRRLRAVHRHPHRRPAGAAALVRRAWDLPELGRRVRAVRRTSAAAWPTADRRDDEAAYAARFPLVHAWRAFLFRDPQLPPVLLPRALAGRRGRGVLRPPRGPAAPRRRPVRRPVPRRSTPAPRPPVPA